MRKKWKQKTIACLTALTMVGTLIQPNSFKAIWGRVVSAETIKNYRVYFNDFENSTTDNVENGAKIVGSGKIEDDIIEDSTHGKVFHNAVDGQGIRKNYLVLPEDTLSKAVKVNNELTISMDVNVGTAINFYHSPLFSAHDNQKGETEDSWNMFQISAKGYVYLNTVAQGGENSYEDMNETHPDKANEGTQYLDDKKWHNILVTFTKSKVVYYIDGEKYNTFNVQHNGFDAFLNGLGAEALKYICLGGCHYGSGVWSDPDPAFLFDNIAIYSKALTAEQVETLCSGKVTDITITPEKQAVVNEYIYASEQDKAEGNIEESKCGSVQLSASVEPPTAIMKDVEWSIDTADTAKATIDQTGLVKLTENVKENDTITIYATAKDGSEVKGTSIITASVKETIVPPKPPEGWTYSFDFENGLEKDGASAVTNETTGKVEIVEDEERGKVLYITDGGTESFGQNYYKLPKDIFKGVTAETGTTISMWVKIPKGISDQKSVLFSSTPKYNDWNLWKVNANLDTGVNAGTPHAWGDTGEKEIEKDTWHHITSTLTKEMLNVYLDGKLVGNHVPVSPEGTNNDYTGPLQQFVINEFNVLGAGGFPTDQGKTSNRDISDCYYDNVMIYPTALTAEKVQQLYKAGISVKEEPPVSIPVTGISLNKKELTLEVGKSETLVATIIPENATDKGVQWSSDDEKIATVDASGKVTAIAIGNTNIKATSVTNAAITASCAITVKQTGGEPTTGGAITNKYNVITEATTEKKEIITDGWWKEFSDYYQLTGDFNVTFNITNKGGENAWNNPVTVFTTAAEREDKENYKEYAVIRSDSWGWGGGDNLTFDGNAITCTNDWAEPDILVAAMKDATITKNIVRSGNGFTMKDTIVSADGKTFTTTTKFTTAADKTMNIFLTTDTASMTINSYSGNTLNGGNTPNNPSGGNTGGSSSGGSSSNTNTSTVKPDDKKPDADNDKKPSTDTDNNKPSTDNNKPSTDNDNKKPSTDNDNNTSKPNKNTSKKVNKGKKVKDSNSKASYKVTTGGNSSKATVEYEKPTGKAAKATTVVIPNTIKVSGVTCKVTSIKANAFKNNKNLKKLTVSKNIKKIGKQAFYNCKSIKTLTIKSKKLTAKNIGKNAFKGINSKATIKVPKSKVKAYKKLFRQKGLSASVKIVAL